MAGINSGMRRDVIPPEIRRQQQQQRTKTGKRGGEGASTTNMPASDFLSTLPGLPRGKKYRVGAGMERPPAGRDTIMEAVQARMRQVQSKMQQGGRTGHTDGLEAGLHQAPTAGRGLRLQPQDGLRRADEPELKTQVGSLGSSASGNYLDKLKDQLHQQQEHSMTYLNKQKHAQQINTVTSAITNMMSVRSRGIKSSIQRMN